MSPRSASDIADSLIHRYSTGDQVRTYIFAAFAAIAWYNAIELIILCFVSFKRHHGCYFWSLLIASASIVPHCLGYVLLFFPTGVTPWVCVTLIVFSWVTMVTGQSVVLWSRLHLVLQNTKVLWGVLWMIIIDAVLFHTPTIVLLYGTTAEPFSNWSQGYDIMERIQLVGFCIQELVISGIYVWETVKLLKLRPQGRPHGILNQLLLINIIILVLDIAVVVIEYVGYYAVQVMFKPVAYSIKLKLEYAILGKLVAIARGSYNGQELPSSELPSSEMPSSMREIDSFPSSQEQPTQTNYRRNFHRQYSPPWFWERSQRSSCTSSGI
ncbi:hypothetical protein N7462_008318 [Penicillium macrosclerotiorum]|uniref:uncharacterized protein n=1 Tax=Penicillium macrosclerotiorum TaxID=303699 RepID=UPI002547927D|nr:uncharacterized protein N7462_008318 [Penicillium macrosclerotiorum]KAJ5675421.1 hypothetical protein N7462_008318 [Penicillium macrosclerotiorum]